MRASQWHVVMSVPMSVLARMASVVSRVLCHALRVMCVPVCECVDGLCHALVGALCAFDACPCVALHVVAFGTDCFDV